MKTKFDGRRSTLEYISDTLRCIGGIGNFLASELDRGNHAKLTAVTVNPNGYDDWREFFRDYSCALLAKKYSSLELAVDAKQASMVKFLKSEVRCGEMNLKFSHLNSFTFRERSLLEAVRLEVRNILGKFSWDAALPFCSHGPGASVGVLRSCGHQWYKYGERTPSVTGQCLALFDAFASYTSLWSQDHEVERPTPKVVRSSKVAIVPKDARCSRTIAVEPLWNMFFQKGIGGLMRSRLKRRESFIDLNDQCRNQELARLGSIDSSLATLDLASASDTISRGLVEFLLPPDWLEACNITRTHYTSLPGGEELFLQKFSSMGNGFTFELESVIFYALLRVTCLVDGKGRRDVSVYGDDLVVPSWAAAETIWGLRVLGFETNVSKSFVSGPFRESCGKHYFRGHDVTPIFLKKPISDISDIMKYHNALILLAHRFVGYGWGKDSRFLPIVNTMMGLLPRWARSLSIPIGYGDGGLVRDLDDVAPNTVRREPNYVEGYVVRHLTRVYRNRYADDHPGLLCRLRPGNVGVTSEQGLLVPTSKFTSRVVRLHVRRWPSLGSWV